MSLHERNYLSIAVVLCAMVSCQVAAAYQLAQRWTTTASGTVPALGSAVTLTWSIMPDGSPIDQLGTSDLISFLDTSFGMGAGGDDLTTRPWFRHFEESLTRWSDLSGVTYVYEPHDDGVPHGNFPGVLGVRGDIRIGGAIVDGGGSVLAYNYFPNNSDMILDTSEQVLMTNPDANFLRMRMILMHELGHGLGLAHVDAPDSDQLMELFLEYDFDGPQIDDIRGVHRAYGDRFEKENVGAGNNAIFNATQLGSLTSGVVTSLGTDVGNDTHVDPTATDFLSIDDNSDADFFAFDIAQAGSIDLVLTPVGPTYTQGPRGGQLTTVNTAAVSDLTLALFDSDGFSLIALANQNGLGVPEQLLDLQLNEPGRYYARITGNANDVQLYRLDVSATLVPEPSVCSCLWMLTIVASRSLRRS